MCKSIKGYLKFLVLNELNVGSKTGYSLMNNLEEYNGKRPSSGSVYPLLESLLEQNYISVKYDGKKKIYSILMRGKKLLDKLKKEKEVLIKNHLEMLNSNGTEIKFPMKDFDNQKDAILRNMGIFIELKRTLLKFGKKDFQKHEKEFRKIIRETIDKLNQLE